MVSYTFMGAPSWFITFSPADNRLGGVGHCFAWHVRVSFGFYFNFETEELVQSGLCVMHLGHNRIFPADRIRILPQKINILLLHF
jgi:hypothetical protein